MEQAIYTYIQRIILFGILVSIASKLLPESKYGKYLKLYTGFLFLFLVLLPIVQWIGADKNWYSFYKQYESELQFDGVEQETKEKLFSKYEETLAVQLAKVLKEQGYTADVTVITDRKGEGQIQEVMVSLKPENQEEQIYVPAVEINGNAKKRTEEDQKQIEEVKQIVENICADEGSNIKVEVNQE